MDSPLRTFIAVELPQECIEFIASIQSQIQSISPNVKWVKPSNCHITLKFLGNVPAETIRPIIQKIEMCLENTSVFSVETTNIGAFPSLQRPEILWVGVNNDQKKLTQLACAVEEASIPLGFSKEDRAFSAHITFARMRSAKKSVSLTDSFSSIRIQPIIIPVHHITFYQSILSSQGPEYTPLHRWPLK